MFPWRLLKLTILLAAMLMTGLIAWKLTSKENNRRTDPPADSSFPIQTEDRSAVSQDDQILNNERAFSNRIKKACGWGPEGFLKRINEVDAEFLAKIESESDPEKVLWDREMVFWKEVLKRYGSVYEKTQRKQNNLREISTTKWREPLMDIFAKRLELRGGGSVSQEMWMYLPGYIEWILGHMETGEAKPPTHEQLFQDTLQGYPFHLGLDPSAKNRVAKVLSDLKHLESQMPARQAAFVRAEFERFFTKEIPVSSSYEAEHP